MNDLRESTIVKRHQPCDDCGSSDALAVYDDGHTYCFSCEKHTPPPRGQKMEAQIVNFDRTTSTGIGDVLNYRSYPITSRGIGQDVVDHFGVKMEVNEDGIPAAHYYPYTKSGVVAAYKKRELPKNFSTVGDFKGIELFGQAQASGGKYLVITEGELDCLVVAQAMKEQYNQYYSVVSIPSASHTKVILENREFVKQYKEVVLMFDQDEAGKKAAEQAAKIIGYGTTKVAKYSVKDPCELYAEGGKSAVLNAIWNAQTYNPAGILTGEALWEQFIKRETD